MKYIYLLTKIITYPGAFMKGFWEHVTCRILKLKVTDRAYLPADWHCGHAQHEPAMTPAKAYLLAALPYIAQRVLGWILLGASFAPILIFGLRSKSESQFFRLQVVALFFGLSLLCNAFPQWDDAKRQWRLFFGKPLPEEAAALEALIVEEQAAIEAAAGTEEEAAALQEDVAADMAATGEIPLELIREALALQEAQAEQPEEPAVETVEDETGDETEAGPGPIDLPDGLPKFAGLFGKIVFAPCNAWFLLGAWAEKNGIPAILALGTTIALLALKY